MRRSLTVNYIVASFKLCSALIAIPMATLPRHILGGLDVGPTVRMHIRRETPIARRGGLTPYTA